MDKINDVLLAISSKFLEDMTKEGALTIVMVLPTIKGKPETIITASNIGGTARERAECLRLLAKYIDKADEDNTIREVPAIRIQ